MTKDYHHGVAIVTTPINEYLVPEQLQLFLVVSRRRIQRTSFRFMTQNSWYEEDRDTDVTSGYLDSLHSSLVTHRSSLVTHH